MSGGVGGIVTPRMAVVLRSKDPRIPITSWTEHVRFSQTEKIRFYQARRTVGYSATRSVKGGGGIGGRVVMSGEITERDGGGWVRKATIVGRGTERAG